MTKKKQDPTVTYIKICLAVGVLGIFGLLVFGLLVPSSVWFIFSMILAFFGSLEAFMLWAALSYLSGPK